MNFFPEYIFFHSHYLKILNFFIFIAFYSSCSKVVVVVWSIKANQLGLITQKYTYFINETSKYFKSVKFLRSIILSCPTILLCSPRGTDKTLWFSSKDIAFTYSLVLNIIIFHIILLFCESDVNILGALAVLKIRVRE